MNKVDCIYEKECSGCQLLHLPFGEQIHLKSQNLQKLLQDFSLLHKNDIEYIYAQASQLRDRLDFTWSNNKLGLYSKDHQQIIDIKVCQQLSPALQDWLSEFRQIQWPMLKASFRLRIGPQKQKGLWIDAANIDIKALLEEKTILRELQKQCFIEIGQKRKTPVETSEGYKLRDPEPLIWFQSWMGEQAIDLYCQVASFTQPSLAANKKICHLISDWISQLPPPRVLEFGSGIGNLSFPALLHAKSLTVCEIDKLSLDGFRKTLQAIQTNQIQGLSEKVTIHVGDFQKKLTENFANYDLILCNPPRSGLVNFLNPLEVLQMDQRPPYFIYMSCFPESLCKDLQKLTALGYAIEKITIVDQFPQTNHYEVLCLLQRK
jgi:23S rRNA (uracil1939-C5)-methyltransferase